MACALAASALQTSAHNVATDADVRFIWRSSDRTVWYDADDNGAGATVTVADFLVF